MMSILMGIFLGLLPVVAHAQSLNDFSQLLNGVNITSNVSGVSGTKTATGTVDLLYEASSYVPPFYRGRSLPSPGSSIRLQAISHLTRADGTSIPDNAIVYTWYKDGLMLGQLSGQGKSTAVISTSLIQGVRTISLDASAADGSVNGRATLPITFISPFIALYADHPLFGVLYNSSFADTSSTGGVEVTFAAVPYFAVMTSPNDSHFIYSWTVNGSKVPMHVANPSEITIGAGTSTSSRAHITLEVTRTDDALFDTFGAWDVTFGQGGVQNVFNSSHANNATVFGK